jgi:hypothetical protein
MPGLGSGSCTTVGSAPVVLQMICFHIATFMHEWPRTTLLLARKRHSGMLQCFVRGVSMLPD